MDKLPASFTVFVYSPRWHRTRIGNYWTLEEAKQAALDCEQSHTHPETFGGLIGWPKDKGGRTYRIFEATGWREHQT